MTLSRLDDPGPSEGDDHPSELIVRKSLTSYYFIFFFRKIYLFEKERETDGMGGSSGWEGESEADLMLSVEPKEGLNLTTLRS